ncbi:MAG TPA: hypothetical protein VN921_02345 [Chthoniobacterales bacterium]|nr:hypothetical protein [Chthoniobacterales bacterium]
MRSSVVTFLTTALLPVAMAMADDAAAIDKLISEIDDAAKTDKARMVTLIIINTDVARTTLEQEKSRTGFSWGEIYVAHSIALASRKSFNEIAALKAKGQSWAQVAKAKKVSLRAAARPLRELLHPKRSD